MQELNPKYSHKDYSLRVAVPIAENYLLLGAYTWIGNDYHPETYTRAVPTEWIGNPDEYQNPNPFRYNAAYWSEPNHDLSYGIVRTFNGSQEIRDATIARTAAAEDIDDIPNIVCMGTLCTPTFSDEVAHTLSLPRVYQVGVNDAHTRIALQEGANVPEPVKALINKHYTESITLPLAELLLNEMFENTKDIPEPNHENFTTLSTISTLAGLEQEIQFVEEVIKILSETMTNWKELPYISF